MSFYVTAIINQSAKSRGLEGILEDLDTVYRENRVTNSPHK